MARALSALALLLAYLITLLYIAAMCVPWWYTRYYAVGESEATFFANNPSLITTSGLFHRSNCFIDGSCITGSVVYKNNSNLQWVYTTVLVLMLVGWLPWLFFVHLLHFRANKNRNPMKGRRFLMALSALLTMAFLITAVIVFACGFVYNNGVYRNGLYGNRYVTSAGNGFTSIGDHVTGNGNSKRQDTTGSSGIDLDNENAYGNNLGAFTYGSMPWGGSNTRVLGAGIPLLYSSSGVNANNNGVNGQANNAFFFPTPYNGALVGTLGYKWGAHAGWYLTIVAAVLIPLALLLGLLIKPKERVVTTTRTVERTVTTQPAVVQQGVVPQYAPQSYNQAV